jgi:hypothetical protein
MLLTVLEKALRGDMRAASTIMNIVLRLEPNAPKKQPPTRPLQKTTLKLWPLSSGAISSPNLENDCENQSQRIRGNPAHYHS